MRRTAFRGPRGSTWTIDEPTTRRERMRGATGRDAMPPGRALLFRRCRSVHTFGMRQPITVASLNAHLTVRRVRVMRPRRLLLPEPGTRHILECGSDADIRIGDRFVG